MWYGLLQWFIKKRTEILKQNIIRQDINEIWSRILFVSLLSHFWLIHFFSPTPALSTISRPLSSSMCSITPETANVCSSLQYIVFQHDNVGTIWEKEDIAISNFCRVFFFRWRVSFDTYCRYSTITWKWITPQICKKHSIFLFKLEKNMAAQVAAMLALMGLIKAFILSVWCSKSINSMPTLNTLPSLPISATF